MKCGKRRCLFCWAVCVLLPACGQSGGQPSTLLISAAAQEYETLSYGEFKKWTGTEAGFYHAREGMPLTEISEALSAEGAAKAALTRLEGAGTAYYVGNDSVGIRFDSDQDGEYDRLLSISLDESADAAIDPKSAAWLEIDRQV